MREWATISLCPIFLTVTWEPPRYWSRLYIAPRQCIDSILNQTYRNLEILLIDDGSPDKCGEICEGYARLDSRIRIFHTGNKGLSAARNLGLREAKGEYIGFVDSDDWLEYDMYEILLRRLEKTRTNISACGVWKEYLNKRISYSNDNACIMGQKQPEQASSKQRTMLVSPGVALDRIFGAKTLTPGIYIVSPPGNTAGVTVVYFIATLWQQLFYLHQANDFE